MGMRRNFITGEWETFADGQGGTYVVHEGKVIRAEDAPRKLREKQSRSAICSKAPHVSKAMAVPIGQAAEFQAAADRNRTGVRYVPDGKGYANCVSPSRGARAREMRARNRVDNEGSFGDYTGR